ncbi:hypothetical protein WA026_010546 [Henosepilachna vigintioctopunctata]|uniref:Uncharacterized protein n=1 Tax=Henosepilachna vigintioctopunctata TaxID=420089 RepID=A0AAW1VDG2_9CUCU
MYLFIQTKNLSDIDIRKTAYVALSGKTETQAISNTLELCMPERTEVKWRQSYQNFAAFSFLGIIDWSVHWAYHWLKETGVCSSCSKIYHNFSCSNHKDGGEFFEFERIVLVGLSSGESYPQHICTKRISFDNAVIAV